MDQPRILKTQKGSPIKRASIGVGKDIGGAVYLHRNYESHLPNQRALAHAKAILAQHHPDFQYNVVRADKNGRHAFYASPDFDTAHEPTAGEFVTVEGKQSHKSKTNKIWHHKWLWVKDDYPGFDIDQSFNRSKAWLQIPNINFSHIGDPRIWKERYVPRIPAH